MQVSKAVTGRLVTRQYTWRPSNLSTKRALSYVTSRPFLPPHTRPKSSVPKILEAIRSQRRFNSSNTPTDSGETFTDPHRPDLFYHLVRPPTLVSKTLPAFAVSFLPEKPPSPSSKIIIGWLPAQGRADAPEQNTNSKVVNKGATLEDFVANPEFLKVLHSVIKEGLKEGVDEIQKATAMQTIQGWMHLHDQRNIPALNRIGDPDDIIGTVLVDDSEILADTYQPMPAYRLVTSDGLMQLTPGLAQKLHDTLNAIADAERALLP